MQWLRETLPYWSAVLPLALVLFLLRLWRTKSRDGASRGRATGFLTLIPGLSQAAFQERCASFAESLASLVESQVPLEDALPLAAGVCGDARLVGAAQSLAAALKQGQVPDDNDPAATGFPPFLRWAMLHSEATVGRPRALQMAADLYRQAAQRREERLRIVAPIVVCVVLGGSATLLYGLSLFVPVVQLLRALAS
jgi:general secretion pathway protein F